MRRERYSLENSDRVIIVGHTSDKCADKPCTIHNKSNHHMRSMIQHWRDDRGMMERICVHGVGHPDPDDINKDHIHGCDGCCYNGIIFYQ